jgi:hypothetical protein
VLEEVHHLETQRHPIPFYVAVDALCALPWPDRPCSLLAIRKVVRD